MRGFPDRATVRWLREEYPPGQRVELCSMEDLVTRLKPGDQGTVKSVDDAGTIHVQWDCGSNLGVILGVDQIKKL